MYVISCARRFGNCIFHHVTLSQTKKLRTNNNLCTLTCFFRQVTRMISTSKNFYESLGISPNATQQEVKAAYFKLSKLYHPDMNPSNEDSGRKFREISQAYEVLGNANLRKRYDQSLSGEKLGRFDSWNENDPFSKSQRKSARTGRDSYYDYDEWTKRHYEHLFWRREEKMRRREMHDRIRQNLKKSGLSEHYLFTRWLSIVTFIMFVIVALDIHLHEGSEPKPGDRPKMAKK